MKTVKMAGRLEPVLRRALECSIALVAAVITLPLLIVAALASAWTYRTSPFFVHERIGQHGRRFRMIKIRTLPPSTPRYADKFQIKTVSAPPLMHLIRSAHLDELPQLWLVLAGHMSLVGPRPEMATLLDRIRPEVTVERLGVRPGITGLWQISVHCDGLICDRTEYDRLYIQHRTVLLDGWILAKTARKMVLGRRVHLFEVPRWAVGKEPRPNRAPARLRPPPRLDAVTLDLTDDRTATFALTEEAAPSLLGS